MRKTVDRSQVIIERTLVVQALRRSSASIQAQARGSSCLPGPPHVGSKNLRPLAKGSEQCHPWGPGGIHCSIGGSAVKSSCPWERDRRLLWFPDLRLTKLRSAATTRGAGKLGRRQSLMNMGIRDAEIAPLQGPGTTGMPKSEIGPGYQRFPHPSMSPGLRVTRVKSTPQIS